jgi:TonB family protein
VRWDSPIVLVIAGTFAIHTLLLVFVDAAVVTHPKEEHEIAKHIEYIKIEPLPVLKPPPPPVHARTEQPPKDTSSKPRSRTIQPQVRQVQPPPPPTEPPPSNVPSGGDPTVSMPDIAPSATGVAVNVGKANTGPIGRGGKGGGTGAGQGSGAGDAPPPPTPVSVATIKTRALPKGDNSYFDAGKDYPAEARQLGIEGPIRVRLIVDDKGKVKAAVLLNKLGHGLDELALDRSKKIEFDPAKDTDDKPVASVVIWTFNMTLPK